MNRDSATRIGVKTALLVANPAAGGYRPRRIEALSTALSRRGIVTDVRLTRAPGDMQFIATDPETRPDVLIVAGGDGSINEAVAGLLARHGPRPALAVMPAGTANVLAAELRLPRQPVNVARSIAGGLTKPLAVAQANGRPFMLMASAGFDAEVVHAVRPEQKRRWKQLAFIGTAWSLAFGRKPIDLAIQADGMAIAGRLAVVTNARCYGGAFTLVRQASVLDGGLYLVVLSDDRPIALMRAGIGLLTGRIDLAPGVTVRPVAHVRIAADPHAPVQIDGEAHGFSPIEIVAETTAIDIIVAG